MKTTLYYCQTNIHVKKINQTLINILRKIVTISKRNQDTKLPTALWTYRTMFKVTTQVILFLLVYDIEAILPIEFEIPSF